MNKTDRLELRLSPEDKDRLQVVSDKMGVTKAEWIRRKVNKDYERLQKQP